ncbi:VanZ family protein [Spirosoma rigui]|uniref:VanZ family protein n=1 Tax=Spirosoma rigui TaxID=564064 RepID=UPI0009AF9417
MNVHVRTERVRIIWCAYTCLILLLVTLPLNGEDQILGHLNDNYILEVRLDYISHAMLFIPWVLSLHFGWERSTRGSRQLVLYFIAALIFAGGCEFLQLLLPYRTFNINDLLANGLSVGLGYLLLGVLTRSRY